MKNKKGFNLVELTVALGVSAVVGLGVMTLVSNLQKSSKKIEQDFAVSEMKFLVMKAMTQSKHCVANFGGQEVTRLLQTKPNPPYIIFNDLYMGETTRTATGGITYKRETRRLAQMYNISLPSPRSDDKVPEKNYFRYGEGDSQFRVSHIGLENLRMLNEMDMKTTVMVSGVPVERVVKVYNASIDLRIKYAVGENVTGVNNIKDKKAKQVIEHKVALPLTIQKRPNGARSYIYDCGYQMGLDSVACDTVGGEFFKQGNTLECRSIAIKHKPKPVTATATPSAVSVNSEAPDNSLLLGPQTSPLPIIHSRLTVGDSILCPTGATYCQTAENAFKSPVQCKKKSGAVNGIEDCVILGTVSGTTTQDSKRITDYVEFWVNSVTGAAEYDRVKRELEIQFMKNGKVQQCSCRQHAKSRGACTVLSGAPDGLGFVNIPSDSYDTCAGPIVEGGPGVPGYFTPPQELDTRDCNGDSVADGSYRSCSGTSTETDPFNCTDVCGGNGDIYIPCDKSGTSGKNYCEITDEDKKHDIFKQKAGDLYVGDSINVSGNMDIFDYMTIRKMHYTSDLLLKENIKTLTLQDSQKVLNINGVGFDWKRNNQHDLGVVAQEVGKYFPEIIHQNAKMNIKTIETEKLLAPLLEMIKENERIIASQKSRIKEINKKIKQQP
ncbi:MAG: hypothetical protein A2202_07865 [Bdellovibrionales bacterium RIFOXYA1_FULL_36_14]|nr:MAG: hypothetical protein A2202_07865 [Bdellovibrionales bacterium RIFOXYA1_FULL_36_14]